MINRLFVGSLSANTNEQGLRAAFERFGSLEYVRVATYQETGRSRGFGFVTFTDASVAKSALQAMNGAQLDGQALAVTEAVVRVGQHAR
jgi:cold-inducible RNA-binding protein